MTRWLVTPRTVWANLRWLGRFQLERRIRRPRCCSCGRAGADVYWIGSWWCRQHPYMIPARAAGYRPGLRRYTKRQAKRLFRAPDARASQFWKGAPPAVMVEPDEAAGLITLEALEALRKMGN